MHHITRNIIQVIKFKLQDTYETIGLMTVIFLAGITIILGLSAPFLISKIGPIFIAACKVLWEVTMTWFMIIGYMLRQIF